MRILFYASRALLFGVCFASLNSTPLLAQMTSESLYELLKANVLSIRSFDVQVKHWSGVSAESPIAGFDDSETTTHFRLICDFTKQRCVFVQRERTATADGKSSNDNHWKFRTFENGFGSERYLDSRVKLDRAARMSFGEFCERKTIPAPQCYGFFQFPRNLGPSVEAMLTRIVEAQSNNPNVQELPDGTMIVRSEKYFGGTTYHSSKTFSSKSWMPSKQIVTYEQDGKKSVYYEQTASYECADGIYRPISISYSKATNRKWVPPAKNDKPAINVPCSEVGTVELKWFAMNEENMEYPNLDDLGTDVRKWISLVGAEYQQKPQ